jgi:hypothetical protein
MIDLHQAEADYRIALDYMDDIFVMTPADAPTRASFYQVKTLATGNWSLTQLVGRKGKGTNPKSIIGKIYLNADSFGPCVDKLCIVSNAGFVLDKRLGQRSSPADETINGSDLSVAAAARIKAALADDFPGKTVSNDLGLLKFKLAAMTQNQQRGAVIDRLLNYFEIRGNSIGEKFDNTPVQEVAMTLYDTVKAKSGSRFDFKTRADFFEKKTICRAEIEDLFAEASTAQQLTKTWQYVDEGLQALGRPPVSRSGIRNAAFHYVSDRAAGKAYATRFSKLVASIDPTDRRRLLECGDFAVMANMLRPFVEGHRHNPFTEDNDLMGALIVHALEIQHAYEKQRRALAFAPQSER